MQKYIFLIAISFISSFTGVNLFADDLLQDRNQDGIVSVLGLGDSIAFGQGDYHSPGEDISDPELTQGDAGFLQRVELWAGLVTINQGLPGETFTLEGIFRFPSEIGLYNPDLVALLTGANDAGLQVSSQTFAINIQKAINIARAQGREIVLFTVLPTCCEHAGRNLFTEDLSRVIRILGSSNQTPVADIEKAWKATCGLEEECPLFNIPDGLHPNNQGYDLIAHTFLAALYEIDLFSAGGAAELESILGLPSGSVFIPAAISE